jgi:hypothetical protein
MHDPPKWVLTQCSALKENIQNKHLEKGEYAAAEDGEDDSFGGCRNPLEGGKSLSTDGVSEPSRDLKSKAKGKNGK